MNPVVWWECWICHKTGECEHREIELVIFMRRQLAIAAALERRNGLVYRTEAVNE